jgi:hypothetical protein
MVQTIEAAGFLDGMNVGWLFHDAQNMHVSDRIRTVVARVYVRDIVAVRA